jgi:hypothetical protein
MWANMWLNTMGSRTFFLLEIPTSHIKVVRAPKDTIFVSNNSHLPLLHPFRIWPPDFHFLDHVLTDVLWSSPSGANIQKCHTLQAIATRNLRSWKPRKGENHIHDTRSRDATGIEPHEKAHLKMKGEDKCEWTSRQTKRICYREWCSLH